MYLTKSDICERHCTSDSLPNTFKGQQKTATCLGSNVETLPFTRLCSVNLDNVRNAKYLREVLTFRGPHHMTASRHVPILEFRESFFFFSFLFYLTPHPFPPSQLRSWLNGAVTFNLIGSDLTPATLITFVATPLCLTCFGVIDIGVKLTRLEIHRDREVSSQYPSLGTLKG